jgi:hypothetical protein
MYFSAHLPLNFYEKTALAINKEQLDMHISLPVHTVLLLCSANSIYPYAFMLYFCHASKRSIDLQLPLTLSFLAVNILFTNTDPSGINWYLMESVK